jgi:hypothetical protein
MHDVVRQSGHFFLPGGVFAIAGKAPAKCCAAPAAFTSDEAQD